jgi:hypothetical protein
MEFITSSRVGTVLDISAEQAQLLMEVGLIPARNFNGVWITSTEVLNIIQNRKETSRFITGLDSFSITKTILSNDERRLLQEKLDGVYVYSVKTAAIELGISEQSLRSHLVQGHLPGAVYTDRWIIPDEALSV